MTVRTRFAPSPTGPLHIGGVRTALYAYLFAKKNNGHFLLRIEDTDQARYVPGAEQYIIDSLRWCGIVIDEGVPVGGRHAPYRQSERKDLYREYAEKLVASGHAYYAFDTAEALDNARRSDHTFSYGPATRMKMINSLTLSEAELNKRIASNEPHVIRLKVPEDEQISFTDLIRGEVSVNSSTIDDKVLLKSDGMPTYHLAHIVDDVLMEISHAIRGEEWLPSAPAHILIYKYLGWADKMPAYAHLPLILKPEGNGKLSKRDGDRLGFPVFPLEWKDPSGGEISSGYREKGYYPEAFVNMLALIGWNPGTEQEILSMQELIQLFSFEQVHKGGGRFDPDKAKWFNEQYLRRKPDVELAVHLKDLVKNEFHFPDSDHRLSNDFLLPVIHLLKERVQFENEFITKGRYLFEEPKEYDQQVITKKWKPAMKEFFTALADSFQQKANLSASSAEEIFKTTAASHNFKTGEVMQLLRLLLTGVGSGVDLFPMIELLGQRETAHRITNALQHLPNA